VSDVPGRRLRSGLLVDLYQLTMGESYVAEDLAERSATFSLFFRTLPAGWGYALAAGLEVKGPAIFESATTTVLVRESERVTVTPHGWLDIRLG